jgi:hypothetical protein
LEDKKGLRDVKKASSLQKDLLQLVLNERTLFTKRQWRGVRAPPFAISVFLSFTPSQAGMARRWWHVDHLALVKE